MSVAIKPWLEINNGKLLIGRYISLYHEFQPMDSMQFHHLIQIDANVSKYMAQLTARVV